MANNFSPFGFVPVNTSGGPMNWRISTRRIQSTNATPLNKGDVTQAVIPANGYITRGVAADFNAPGTTMTGIFWGCQYLSISQKRVVWSQNWPGNGDANGDIIAYTIDDPNARFLVQTGTAGFQISGTPNAFGSSPVGQYCTFDVGTPNPNTGISGMFADSVAATATYPFIITAMYLDPPGANGTDATSLYNYVEVGFNNEWLRTNSAVLGIA